MKKVQAELGVSERRTCQALGQHRSTQRKPPRTLEDEAALTADIIELAKTYGRYGYWRITALLRHAGWTVNPKRVQRIWRREGLKVPQKQRKRGRLRQPVALSVARPSLPGSRSRRQTTHLLSRRSTQPRLHPVLVLCLPG